MNVLFTLLLATGLVCPALAQSASDSLQTSLPAQAQATRFLALDVSSTLGGFHRYRFFSGDPIRFKSRTDGDKYRAPLYAVTDTSFSLVMNNEIMNRPDYPAFRLNEVQKIYVTHQIPWITAGSVLFPLAGLVFIAADFINPKSPDGHSGRFVFDSKTLLPGGVLIALGGISYKLSYPRYTLNKNHRLRVLKAL